jgi:predicted aconitase
VDLPCDVVVGRRPGLAVQVDARLEGTQAFGALGKAVGEKMEAAGKKPVAFLRGIREAGLEGLKSLCASLATYGGAALFHIEGLTPEADLFSPPAESLVITQSDLEAAARSLDDAGPDEVDFVSLGCPHLSIAEIGRIAVLLRGRQVVKEFWITTARPTKALADRLGYSEIIEASGARFAADTCCVVAPIRGRFQAMATDSAKACYYAYAKNKFKTRFLPFDQVVEAACSPPPPLRGERGWGDEGL